MKLMSSVFVAQFEGKGHGRELGIAVPQKLRTGRVACAAQPPAETSKQLDRLAQMLRWSEAARAGEGGEHAQLGAGEQHFGGQQEILSCPTWLYSCREVDSHRLEGRDTAARLAQRPHHIIAAPARIMGVDKSWPVVSHPKAR